MRTRRKQPAVPPGVRIGDHVRWVDPHDIERVGVVTDILSTQFLIEDRSGHTYIVPFKRVRCE